MIKTSAKKGIVKKRTSDEAINGISFPYGLIEIHQYSLEVITTTNLKKE